MSDSRWYQVFPERGLNICFWIALGVYELIGLGVLYILFRIGAEAKP